MSELKQSVVIFALGAVGYSVLEILWRGFTHWSMGLAGGICFLLIYWMSVWLPGLGRLERCLTGALVITGVELLFGYIFNLRLGWNIWDYSARPFNFMGQICLLYTVLWFFLCLPITFLGDYLKNHLT